MVRLWSVVLGVGLLLLWIAELGSPGFNGYLPSAGVTTAVRWIAWLDLVGALCAFSIAGAVAYRYASRAARSGGPVALAIGLFVLWIIGLASSVAPWMSWWNFGFACAFLLTGIVGALEKPSQERPRHDEEGYGGGFWGYGRYPYQGFGGPFPFFFGADFERGRGSSPYPAERRRQTTRGYQRSDPKIFEDVNDRLCESWDIDASDIEVRVNQGEVTLSGTVASRREKRVAEAIADSVSGVRDVHNDLGVRAVSPRDAGRPRAA